MDTTQEVVTPVSKVALDRVLRQNLLSPTTYVKENKDNFCMQDFRFL